MKLLARWLEILTMDLLAGRSSGAFLAVARQFNQDPRWRLCWSMPAISPDSDKFQAALRYSGLPTIFSAEGLQQNQVLSSHELTSALKKLQIRCGR
jgi:hypothetical protein